jgi:putative tryptophan/tyrosine transport system substrate-binding protein
MATRLVATIAALLLATLVIADARAVGKVPRIGFLAGSTPHPTARTNAFVTALRDYGHVEGQNVAIEWRASGGRTERLPDLVAELLRLRVDVIVAVDNPSISAAQRATKTIPIVMVLATDPVDMGFVVSLPRPGGNITGISQQLAEVQGKALQLLKETIPTVSRVAILWNPAEPGRRPQARAAEEAARGVGLSAQLVGASNAAELDSVFTTMARERPDAVLVQPSQPNLLHRKRIGELAAKYRLPTMGWNLEMVEAGCLMSYGPNTLSLYRRAAYYVDRLLRGARPADLPVEQPTKFELMINAKTAQTIGLIIPPALVQRADQIID